MSKTLELLRVFQTRATDPATYGRNAKIQECFACAAAELELALREDEPEGILRYVPISVINLVHVACHFRHDSDEAWEALGEAAIDIQNGDAS